MRLSLENVIPLRSFSELSSRSSGETKLSGEISSRSSDETRSRSRSRGETLPAKDAAEEAEAASEEVVGEAEEEAEEEEAMTVVEELPSGSGGGVGPDTSVDPLYGDTA